MNDIKMLIQLGYLLLDNSRQFHAAHLNTDDLTYHKMLKEVYEGLSEDGDQLIEAVSGVYGKQGPVPFSNVSVPANSLQAENILRLMMKSVNAVSCENRGVNAVLDNIAAHLDSWIFLISQCNADGLIPEQKVPDYSDFNMGQGEETPPEPTGPEGHEEFARRNGGKRKSMFPMRG